MRQTTIGWVLIIIMIFGGGSSLFAQDPASGDDYDALEIIFVVDHSGSMGGEKFGSQEVSSPTDELGLRFEVIQYAVSMLGEYGQLFNDVDISVSVIYFGSQVDTGLSWTALNKISRPEWETLQIQLNERLSEQGYLANHRANLGFTNFVLAYQHADQLFARTTTSSNPLQVVVMLTDGEPCVPTEFDCLRRVGQQELHMEQVLIDTQNTPERLFYVIAIDHDGRLWSRQQDNWEKIVRESNRAQQVKTSTEIGGAFRNILSEITNILRQDQVAHSVNLEDRITSVNVPPFQREILISIFKTSVDPAQLIITRPDGTLATINNLDVNAHNQDRPIETWSITTPSPGVWTFDLGDEFTEINVYLDFIPIDVDIQRNLSTTRIFEPSEARFQIVATDGGSLPPLPSEYQEVITITATGVDGVSIPLTPIISTPYIYEITPIFQNEGMYRIGFNFAIINPDGDRQTIFNYPELMTLDIIGYDLDINPASLKSEWLAGEILQLQGTLVDEQGISSPEALLKVNFLSSTGQPITTYIMETVGDGQYNTHIPLTLTGQFNVEVVAEQVYDGQTVVLAEVPLGTIQILPSELIALRLIDPINQTCYQTDPLPPFADRSCEILFEVVNEALGQRIDLSDVVLSNNAVWDITATTKDNQTYSVSDVESTDDVGIYQIKLDDLPNGQYQVNIGLETPLTQRYVLHPEANQISLIVKVADHPHRLLFYGALVLVALAILLGVFLLSKRIKVLRTNPIVGYLSLEEQQPNGLWLRMGPIYNLSAKQSNKITISGKFFKAKSSISRIKVVGILDDYGSEQKMILRLTVTLAKSKQEQSEVLYRDGDFFEIYDEQVINHQRIIWTHLDGSDAGQTDYSGW